MIYLVEFEAYDPGPGLPAPDLGPIRYYQRDGLPLGQVASNLAGVDGVTLVWDMDFNADNSGFAGIAFEHSPNSNNTPGFWMSPRSEGTSGVGQLLLSNGAGAYNIQHYPMASAGIHRYVWTMDLRGGNLAPHTLWIDGVKQTLTNQRLDPITGGLTNQTIFVGARSGNIVTLKGGLTLPLQYQRILSDSEIQQQFNNAPGLVVTERFATDGYITHSTDTPADTYFEERVINPGTFQQAVFDDGTTSGEALVGYGYIELAILDDGTGDTLDRLHRFAVDGRPIRIYGLESTESSWGSKTLILNGTMQQIELSWDRATIRINDRLDDLRIPIQETLYLGTTTDGTKTDAEGTPDDLKDRQKPLAYGVNRIIPAVLSNRFRNVYDIGVNGLSSVDAVYDRGVLLTNTGNQASLSALLNVSLNTGQYATFLAGGKIRIGGNPTEVTVDASEGAANARSAARVAQRILERSGFIAGTDFSLTDLDALHNLNPAPLGVWIGPQPQDVFPIITQVLDSVGAYIVPDSTGIFRFGRIDAPTGTGPIIDRGLILDQGQGIERVITNDQRNGVAAKKVTLEYAPAWLVQRLSDLDLTASSQAYKAYASEEYRKIVSEDVNVGAIHLKAAELQFRTLLANSDDAQAEALRRLNLYKVQRDRYRVPLKAEMAEGIELGDIVTLRVPRFDLAQGKPMLVIGREVVLPNRQGDSVAPGIITLDLFG